LSTKKVKNNVKKLSKNYQKVLKKVVKKLSKSCQKVWCKKTKILERVGEEGEEEEGEGD
jgi:DNA-binding ferritin-like protein (Dps family)